MQRFDVLSETAIVTVALDLVTVNGAEFRNGIPVPAGPNRSLMILKYRPNPLPSHRPVGNQLAVPPTGKPSRGADPKSPIARRKQALNVVAGEMLIAGRPPRGKPDTIEPNQAEFRSEPEITVGRLSECVDDAFEKAFADRPRGVGVLINVERGV